MLTIKDLVANKEMTKQAMAVVFGGGHRIGNYAHYHNGPWVRTYARAFRLVVRRGGRLYRAVQYQFTWKRVQSYHRGILRIYS